MSQLAAEDQVINDQLAGAAERALALATVALMDRHAPDDALAWLELHAGLSGLHLRDGQPRGDFGGLLAPAHDDRLDQLMLQVIQNMDGLATALAGQAGEELIRGRANWRTQEQRKHLVETGQLGDSLDPVGARACLLRRREVMKARADLKRVWDPR